MKTKHTPKEKDETLKPFSNAFNNLIKLDEMVLNKAHQMLKSDIEDDKNLIRQNLKKEKPDHLTNEQWENYKKVGERLLNI